MTAEQSLVGAMGCASWRTRHRLLEYAAVAPAGAVIRGGPSSGPTIQANRDLGLNEVGVTDSVMTTLWQFGPASAAYAVSSGAESNHLGADIAIVHSSTSRILLYQAKLARLDGSDFDLKSDATTDQIALLNQATVTVGGSSYSVTGRLALYQADVTPFLDRCDPDLWFHWWRPWRWGPGWPSQNFDRLPEVGRRYYEEILRFGCSPSGVVATCASGTSPISSVAVTATWPWEFDTHTWLNGGSPVDGGAGNETDGDAPQLEGVPEFGDYQPAPTEPTDGAGTFARELAGQLNLADTRQLFLILL